MKLRRGQTFGKYRIQRRLAEGGFATVYEAVDTLESSRVALKIPHAHLVTAHTLASFKEEARTQARLDHPNIMPLKNAEFVDGHLVLVSLMGEGTLADRMRRRMGLETWIHFADQMLAAVAHAHERGVIHCDIKPENMILFPGDHLRLGDFGIAKVSLRTIQVSGSGTLGYMGPDQALGKASFRSDVFSLGLVLYEMLARRLPEWPFAWPPPGSERLARRIHPDLLDFLRCAMEPDPARRFADASHMHEAFERLLPRVRRFSSRKASRRRKTQPTTRPRDWRVLRQRQFLRRYRKDLELRATCGRCQGPVSEFMDACPWCGAGRRPAREPTRFPTRCPRCGHGRKKDWKFCGFCYGAGMEEVATRSYSDRRYLARCTHAGCRGPLLSFLRYCPWCRRKVRRHWPIPGRKERCPRCHWGVARDYWSHCPWCSARLGGGRGGRPPR